MNNADEQRYADLVDEMQQGRDAYTLKEKLMKESLFIEMRAELMRRFEKTSFKEKEEREEIWRKMHTIAWFDNNLTQLIDNGRLAEDELSSFDKVKRLFKR